MITVEHLTRRYGSFTAVDDLSFQLEPGEVVGFLGLNGAGKTTTLRILTGYLPASSGRVEICGFDVLRQSLEVRRSIGYLPEGVPLYKELRLEEMLTFQARLHGMERSSMRQRIPELLERVGLQERARSLVGDLSKGQRQRAGLAVALLPDPKVLILDEPTSGLDPLQRREVRELIAELAQQHTVLFSSHILPEVEAVCPRVIILHKGKLVADGTPETLRKMLGGESCVRVDAVCGADPEPARRLLSALPGVVEVLALGRLGIHQQYKIRCEEDLREDVGALAAQRGWALRELSWHKPTLEELFARVALELQGKAPDAAAAPPKLGSSPAHGDPGAGLLSLGPPVLAKTLPLAGPANSAAPAAVKPRVVYNLNPFDMGASRDLSKPKAIEPPPVEPGGKPPA